MSQRVRSKTLGLPRLLALMSMMSLYKAEAGFGPCCCAYSLRDDTCRNLPWCLKKKKIWLLRGVAVAWLTAVLWYLSWVYGTRFLSLLALWVESSDVSSSCQFYNVSSFLMTCPFYQKSARSRRGRRTQNSSLQCRKLAQIKFERASLTFPGTANVRTEWTIETVVLFAPLQQQ